MSIHVATIGIDGMTCSSCTSTVEAALKSLTGVQNVVVSLTTNSTTVEYDRSVLSTVELIVGVESVGFDAKVLSDKQKTSQSKSPKTPKTPQSPYTLNSLILGVDGMTCSSCTSTVEKAVRNVNGVLDVDVSLTTNTANITYNSTLVATATIAKEIENVGFDVKVLSDTKQQGSKRGTVRPLTISRTAVISIEGMTCTSCTSTIENALTPKPGVTVRSINLATNTATIDYDSGMADVSTLVNEIENVGFEAKCLSDTLTPAHPRNITIASISKDSVDNEDYDDDSDRIKTVLLTLVQSENQPPETDQLITEKLNKLRSELLTSAFSGGIDSIEVHVSDAQLKIAFDELLTGPRDFSFIAESAGMRIQISSFGGFMMATRLLAKQKLESLEYLHAVLWSVSLTIPIVILAMVLPMMSSASHFVDAEIIPGLTYCGIILLILTTPVEFVIGYRFHKKALQSLRTHTLGMDFMISTGSLAAYMCSILGMIRGIRTGVTSTMDTSYFDTSAVLITAVLLGKYLEIYARGQTASAIHKLTAMKAKTARLVGTMPLSVYSADEEEGRLNTYIPLSASPRSPIGTTFTPQTNCVEMDENNEQVIDSSLLHKYDIIRLVAGESIPADGELLVGGHIGVDESMMTGESAMVTKKYKDVVFGGTTVVEGSALMRVTALGDDSTLGKIISTVQEAQTSKPPIQEFADKIALLFVPAVAIISICTFVLWYAASLCGIVPASWYAEAGSKFMMSFLFALAVWVSACPCAFGLATPTAVLVATGIAAKNGVLIRRGAALQYAAEINTVAFDKTGTLTRGCTEVSDFLYINSSVSTDDSLSSGGDTIINGTSSKTEQKIIALPNFPLDSSTEDHHHSMQGLHIAKQQTQDLLYILRLLLAVEVRSSHPLAKGITVYCKQVIAAIFPGGTTPSRAQSNTGQFHIPTESELTFDVVPGQGVHMFTAYGNDTPDLHVLVGSPKLLESRNIALSPFAVNLAKSYRAGGKVAVYMAVNGVLRVIMGVADAVRPEAVYMITALKRRGLHCYMVTGDEPLTARAIGATVGIAEEDILASAKPEDKEQFIAALQARGCRVAFIGDGTNDSPALARADVGLSMASGSDIAVEAGDMVLCKNDLGALVTALDLSRHTLMRIKLNYVWAFGYNILLIPIAAGVLYPSFHFALHPMFAGAAMAASSVSIVVSSLLLLLYKPPEIDISRHRKVEESVASGEDCNCPASSGASHPTDGTESESLMVKFARSVSNSRNGFERLSGDDDMEHSLSAVEMLTIYKQEQSEKQASSKKTSTKSSTKSLNRKARQTATSKRSLVASVMSPGCGCGKGNCKCGAQCRCGISPVTNYGTMDIETGEISSKS